jgi:hypothetical protein
MLVWYKEKARQVASPTTNHPPHITHHPFHNSLDSDASSKEFLSFSKAFEPRPKLAEIIRLPSSTTPSPMEDVIQQLQQALELSNRSLDLYVMVNYANW